MPARLALLCILTSAGATLAWSAPPSAENARVCREKAIAAYPTQIAGAAQGSAKAQRSYFQDCIAQMRAEQSNAPLPKKRQAPPQK
jgi:hypothetical protein